MSSIKRLSKTPSTLQLIQHYLSKHKVATLLTTMKTLDFASSLYYPPIDYLEIRKKNITIRIITENDTLVSIHHYHNYHNDYHNATNHTHSHNATSYIHNYDLADPKSLQRILTKLQNLNKKYE